MASWFKDAFGFTEKKDGKIDWKYIQSRFEISDDGKLLMCKSNEKAYWIGIS